MTSLGPIGVAGVGRDTEVEDEPCGKDEEPVDVVFTASATDTSSATEVPSSESDERRFEVLF
jgi:hypothetical protein